MGMVTLFSINSLQGRQVAEGEDWNWITHSRWSSFTLAGKNDGSLWTWESPEGLIDDHHSANDEFASRATLDSSFVVRPNLIDAGHYYVKAIHGYTTAEMRSNHDIHIPDGHGEILTINSNGQLFVVPYNFKSHISSKPVQIPLPCRVVDLISDDPEAVQLVLQDGSLWSMGNMRSGLVFNGESLKSDNRDISLNGNPNINNIASVSTATELDFGRTVALTVDGAAWTWYKAPFTYESARPTEIKSQHKFKAVGTSPYFSYLMTQAGLLQRYGWTDIESNTRAIEDLAVIKQLPISSLQVIRAGTKDQWSTWVHPDSRFSYHRPNSETVGLTTQDGRLKLYKAPHNLWQKGPTRKFEPIEKKMPQHSKNTFDITSKVCLDFSLFRRYAIFEC